ncbi:hypothetical protein HLB23_33600 [Nocardia uniformis]|uniref:Uncharacterized protein n=1 Tax=Nocardia uniformis TaxID=53432 RepID=A0A849CGA6_9NOCA|nr:hypothetical protein [Nocardia uniformis]NNH74729.1 hypothetical protein [Nocardia uniformis]
MIKKTIAAAALAAGAVLALAPAAGADIDPTQFNDHTAAFVPYNDPAALNAAADGKLLIISPYGTSRTIACKGDIATELYDCAQDDDFGGIWLKPIDTPLGKAWSSVG